MEEANRSPYLVIRAYKGEYEQERMREKETAIGKTRVRLGDDHV
jgi:hypothetical protein